MLDRHPHPAAALGPRVGLAEDREVHGWCEALGVTEEELRVAVAAVGDDADEVRSHLGRAS
jgi:hypothetical protein